MRHGVNFAAMLVIGFAAAAGSAAPAGDPLTKLPLIASAGTVMQIPGSQMCSSKMQADFYSINGGKFSAAVDWYSAHLPGFRKTHAYGKDREQDTFYNSDGTVNVSLTARPGKDGQDVDVDSVVYAHLQPGLTEKQIIGLNAGHLVCN